MTTNKDNIISYFNMSNNINVGSGHNILVSGYGHASLPTSPYFFNLHNVYMPLNKKISSLLEKLPLIMMLLLNLTCIYM